MNTRELEEFICSLFTILPAFPYKDERIEFSFRECGRKNSIKEARFNYQEKHKVVIKTVEVEPDNWWWHIRKTRIGVDQLLAEDAKYWIKYQTYERMCSALTMDQDLIYYRSVEERLMNEDQYVREERKRLKERNK